MDKLQNAIAAFKAETGLVWDALTPEQRAQSLDSLRMEGLHVLANQLAVTNDDDDVDITDEWDEFTAKYTLVKNHLDDNASGNGFMFETYGPELEFVKNTPNGRIWTLIDADGNEYIIAGWHYVNRMGYFISEQPWADESESYDYLVRVGGESEDDQ